MTHSYQTTPVFVLVGMLLGILTCAMVWWLKRDKLRIEPARAWHWLVIATGIISTLTVAYYLGWAFVGMAQLFVLVTSFGVITDRPVWTFINVFGLLLSTVITVSGFFTTWILVKVITTHLIREKSQPPPLPR